MRVSLHASSKNTKLSEARNLVGEVILNTTMVRARLCPVNPEIFARISLPRIALKVIFAALKIRDKGMIYLYQ